MKEDEYKIVIEFKTQLKNKTKNPTHQIKTFAMGLKFLKTVKLGQKSLVTKLDFTLEHTVNL